jgi:hypothetical protein
LRISPQTGGKITLTRKQKNGLPDDEAYRGAMQDLRPDGT